MPLPPAALGGGGEGAGAGLEHQALQPPRGLTQWTASLPHGRGEPRSHTLVFRGGGQQWHSLPSRGRLKCVITLLFFHINLIPAGRAACSRTLPALCIHTQATVTDP